MPYSIGIYQNNDSSFSDIICNALSLFGFNFKKCPNQNESTILSESSSLSVYTVDCAALLPDFLNICILESGYQKSNSFPQADIVIVPDICSVSTISQLKPKSVVTYGLSCKNTVTVSSLIEERLVVSIQREIVSLSGKRIIEQEFSIVLENLNKIEALLASISLLLLLDVSIDEIKHAELFSFSIL